MFSCVLFTCGFCFLFFFFKQKTAYEMRISDWSSDVCSSDLHQVDLVFPAKCDDRAVIGHIEGDTFAMVCDTGVAGRGPELAQTRRLRQLPRQRMFPAAGAHKQAVHDFSADRKSVGEGKRG